MMDVSRLVEAEGAIIKVMRERGTLGNNEGGEAMEALVDRAMQDIRFNAYASSCGLSLTEIATLYGGMVEALWPNPQIQTPFGQMMLPTWVFCQQVHFRDLMKIVKLRCEPFDGVTRILMMQTFIRGVAIELYRKHQAKGQFASSGGCLSLLIIGMIAPILLWWLA